MVLLISYDLDNHARPKAYEQVRAAIEASARSWCRPLYSQWLVETDSTAAEWATHLQTVIHSDDRLLVCEVTREAHGWLPRELWHWLNQRARAAVS